MLSPGILYTTAALMALVAAACTVLCLVWSVPVWRRRLAPEGGTPAATTPGAGGLSGWPAAVGSGLVSAGLAASALLAWCGVYCTLAAV
jgi:hypothetical protein